MCSKSKEELLSLVKKCKTISELFELVRREKIELRMQSLSSASCLPPKVHNIPTGATSQTPLSRLKDAVCACVTATK